MGQIEMAVMRVDGVLITLDDTDAAFVRSLHSVSIQHGIVHARPDVQSTTLARILAGLERGDPRRVRHANGDRMDFRRANLEIVTPRWLSDIERSIACEHESC